LAFPTWMDFGSKKKRGNIKEKKGIYGTPEQIGKRIPGEKRKKGRRGGGKALYEIP